MKSGAAGIALTWLTVRFLSTDGSSRQKSCCRYGIDAPICQDGRSGGFTELLARAEVSHDALIDFPSEQAFTGIG